MFYENRQTEAPLCSNAWNYKQTCNRKCQRTGLEPREKDGWSTPDKILLAVLSIFGFGMLIAILRKRQKMSNKDALLEQAAIRRKTRANGQYQLVPAKHELQTYSWRDD